MPESIGDPRKRHPIPLHLRNPLIEREQGGAAGYRGKGWARARRRAIKKARGRSTVSGLTQAESQLSVDHIIPYRLSLTPHTNEQTNLRVTDLTNNPQVDNIKGYSTKSRRPRMRTF